MKIIVYPLLLLLSHAVSTTAQLLNEFSLDDMEMAFEVMRATENIDNVIADFEMGAANAQPVCSHPTGNCKLLEKDIVLDRNVFTHLSVLSLACYSRC